jgi:hypothetical protein
VALVVLAHGQRLVGRTGSHGPRTDVRKLPAKVLRPSLPGLIAFFFISGFSLL